MPSTEAPPADLPFLLPTQEMIEIGDAIYNEALTKRLLGDKLWRLCNMYWIKPEGGGDPVRFRPRDNQMLIYKHLIETPNVPVYIIKSRRLGFSTALSVFSGDQVCFEAGRTINLVDLTQPDAFKKMRELIRYAVDSLPLALRDRFEFSARNESHLAMRVKNQPESAISNLFAGMNARGGDASGLWVSEWGPLAAQDPHRSGKILAGAFPAARKGWRAVETTWMGGKQGDLWSLIQPIYSGSPNADGKIYFFPWHGDPVCVSITGEITEDVRDYFRDLEDQLGKKFSDEQKKWWAVEKTRYGIKMSQEFPSTLEEALSAPGNAPKFSERGCNYIEKHQKDYRCQFGNLTVRNDRAVWEELGEREGSAWLRVWEHPLPGHSYVLAEDWCTGQKTVTENPDFHAWGVVRASYLDPAGHVVPAALVAAIKAGRKDEGGQRTELDVGCKQIRAMQLYYGECLVAPEINNLHGIIQLLQQAGVTNIYERQLYPDSKEDKRLRTELGWVTSSNTKPIICDKLATTIREEGLLVYCPHVLSELRAFQTNNEALVGHHDDWVMMLAIANHVLPQASPMIQRRQVIERAPSDHHGLAGDNSTLLYDDNLRDSMF